MNVKTWPAVAFGLSLACFSPGSAPGEVAGGGAPGARALDPSAHARERASRGSEARTQVALGQPAMGTTTRTGASPTRPPAQGARSLRVATWNLEWLHAHSGKGPVPRSEADYARLRRYAERLDADVIALQEVDGVEAAARVFSSETYALYISHQSETQRTGFAFRKELQVTVHPDYAGLAVGQLRVGADLTVAYQGQALRMLSVHLKSGCYDAPLTSSSKACQKLRAQLPVLEAWIDARSREGVAALVLGDFNRRFFGAAPDPFWRELDDATPPDSDLWSPTEGQRSRCWGGKRPEFIDHIIFNRPATRLFAGQSFEQLLYDAGDAGHKRQLSDHCPLTVTLSVVSSGAAARNQSPPPAHNDHVPAHRASESASGSARGPAAHAPQAGADKIKGNVSGSQRRLYHAPGCPDYARTKIDEAKGERWFSSRAEAEAAGWTKAANCP